MAADPKLQLQLIRKTITLEEALDEEDNILQQADYPEERLAFCGHLIDHLDILPAIVAHHLNINPQLCNVTPYEQWRHGSFNWCIPIDVNANGYSRVMLRFPLPYKVGEKVYPGNADEKLRCEAATYIYIQQNCPDVPIPKLWGFGFSNGSTFAALENASFFRRAIRYLYDRILSFHKTIPCRFFRFDFPTGLDVGYLLMDYVQEGEMLSQSFKTYKDDEKLQSNLFTDLARILISLGRIPQPRIGSFTIDDTGRISLSNRPLTHGIHMLENEQVPTNIPRNTTYSSVGAYVLDLLDCHDNRLIYQPNSINDEEDGRRQMAAISLMRAVSTQYINHEARHGPFRFILTDLHQSNIFVDKYWHITSIIDLEWACSLPAEFQQPPYWLTGQDLDSLTRDELDRFRHLRDRFMSIFEREERLYTQANQAPRTGMMQRNWNAGSFWFFSALSNTKALYNLFSQHIRPQFSEKLAFQEVSPYWRTDTQKVIQAKMSDRQAYIEALTQRFVEGN